ncbi:MAG: nucleotidyltransferase domain-containing protein [Candidatus Lambdaproteobacteria bacterium]|nr:nucleotidyltransferase domain-containing protein [Candidatus Lambdaproteobacteria bacterium]
MTRDEAIRHLSRFKAANQARYTILRLGLFGSAARDALTDRSDLDIVVELAVPDPFHVIGIKQDLEEQLHCPVDVVRYRATMNPFLKDRIDREAVYV